MQSSKFCQLDVKRIRFQNRKKESKLVFDHSTTLNFHVMVKDILKLKYVLGTKSSLQTNDSPDNPHPKVRMERDMNQMNNKQSNPFKTGY